MCSFTSSNSESMRRSGVKKQVRFEEDKLEQLFELDISADEATATWMSRADFRAIQGEIYRAVKNNVVGQCSCNDEDDEDYCFRGLEPIVASTKVQIQAFVQDLLEMQEDYRMYGYDSTGLHLFSESYSKSAKERARSLADQDAWEARRVYAESMDDISDRRQ